MVDVPDSPGLIWRPDGFAERLKSGPKTWTRTVMFSKRLFAVALMFTL